MVIQNYFSGSFTTLCGTKEYSPLDGFQVQVLILAKDKVWTHNANLLASSHTAREHTTKGIEATLIAGWYHLGDVHHQRCIRIAVLYA